MGDEVELVAFCNHTAGKAEAFAGQYGASGAGVFTDPRDMLEHSALDLLIVCLPPFAHSNEVELAAERGVHLLMEKPIALSSEDAWRMVEAAEGAGIKTQVGFMYRFGAAVEKLKGLLASGEAGPASLMSAGYFCNSLHAAWWRDRSRSGGQVVEQVIHLFDLMRYLLGEPVSVYSRQQNLYHRDVPDYTVEDTSATVVQFASGALGVAAASNGAIPGKWVKEWRVVTGKLMADFTDWNRATFTPTAGTGSRSEIVASELDVFQLQLHELLAAIRAGGETRTPLREGAHSLDLVLAARQSSETGQPVTL